MYTVVLRLRFATAGSWRCCVTQSMPAITPLTLPVAVQPSTRTASSRAPLATPYVAPPTVPATCVPWPEQSSVPRPSATTVKAPSARPPNSWWLVRMPESMMYTVTPAPVLAYA